MSHLVVSEVFGPTLQGEGPSTGRPAAFLRLGGCNLYCQWCDTPFTWDWKRYDPKVELTRMDFNDVLPLVKNALPPTDPLLVVSGGEPLNQGGALAAFLPLVTGTEVEVETNGTRAPGELVELVDRFNVSPKLSNSGVTLSHRYRPHALDALADTGKAVWKFVVTDRGDLDEVERMVAAHDLAPVYIMPEGTDAETLLQRQHQLADAVVTRGWHMTTRLHVQLWGDARGR